MVMLVKPFLLIVLNAKININNVKKANSAEPTAAIKYI